VAANLWISAFRSNFIPFWSHCASNNIRVSRLNSYQYGALHELNSVTNLTLLLSDKELMNVQRLALKCVSSGIVNLEEVALFLNIPNVKGSSCNGGSKSVIDSIRTLANAGSKQSARILHFCRVAKISEQLLIYDLGPKIEAMQRNALLKRVIVNECCGNVDGTSDELLKYIPDHAKCLCACIECKRVTNAVSSDGGAKWNTPFNELGTKVSQIEMDSETGITYLKCARRSSASTKNAISKEESITDNIVQDLKIKSDVIFDMLCTNKATTNNGRFACLRRDAKKSLEQRSLLVSCGHDKMLTVPIVGKAVRFWEEWYSLCVFCGCITRFYPYNRFKAYICCMRCDFKMLNRTTTDTSVQNKNKHQTAPICRFCGKSDPMKSGVRWKEVKSPLDKSGLNAHVPPPLRMVHFCPKHYRSWIPGCMQTMQTRVILSHIVYGAKPCFDVGTYADKQSNPLNLTAIKKRKRKM
jgi:hypothetical protein